MINQQNNKKLKILDTCIGCGACELVCEEAFGMGADGKAFVKPTAGSACREKIKEAIVVCPVAAIVEESE